MADPDATPPGGREPDHARDQPGVAVDDLQRLWAPWRFGYVGGDDDERDGAHDVGDGCPFCTLPARGPDRDRESLILHRGQQAYVIMNAYPYNPGHLMVVPYAHERVLRALDEQASQEVWALGTRAAGVLHDRLGAEGVNLGMNLGPAAGAGIAAHLHLHAVPRWSGDTNFISVLGATRVLPRALTETHDALVGANWAT